MAVQGDGSRVHHPRDYRHHSGHHCWERSGHRGGADQPRSPRATEPLPRVTRVRGHPRGHACDPVLSRQRDHGILVLRQNLVRGLPGFGCSVLHVVHRASVRHQFG